MEGSPSVAMPADLLALQVNLTLTFIRVRARSLHFGVAALSALKWVREGEKLSDIMCADTPHIRDAAVGENNNREEK